MDKIIIKNAAFLCNIGVSSEERSKKQEILIDVELFLDTRKAAKTDSLRYTVNYSNVYILMKGIAEKKEYKLIETLAEGIAKSILDKSNVEKVAVKVKKRLQNKNLKYVAVEIVRRKNG